MNERCRQAYTSIYDLQIQKAENLIRAERNEHPDNLMVLVLEDHIDFMLNVLTQSETDFKRREAAMSSRMDRLEDYTGRSPLHRLSMAEVKLHWALARSAHGQYLTAAMEIRDSYKLLVENARQYPNFPLNLKGLGLMHTLIGTVPEQYKWVVKLIGMEGTVENGMAELRKVMDLSRKDPQMAYLEVETVFLYTLLHVNVLNRPEQFSDLEKYVKAGRMSSPLSDFSLASVYRKQKRNDDAIEVIENGMLRPERYPFPYLRYLLGEMKLYRDDEDADNWLRLYLNTFKGKSYMRSAMQKRAWIALAANSNVAEYKSLISKVPTLPDSQLEDDQQAQHEAELKNTPHRQLLRARLRYDGGYFEEALTELAAIDTKTLNGDQLIEFNYRKARILHDQGKPDEALAQYQRTIDIGRTSKTYFAANASLQMGLIYERKGDREKAKKCFEACTSFSNIEYRNSIEAKAKAGLNRLKK
jgi:tetratricopeptide (TPR) repeat protein